MNTARTIDCHTLVKIELTGLTLYMAETTLSMSDGNVYEGIVTLSNLMESFSSYEKPKQRLSSLRLTLHDENYYIRDVIDAGYRFPGRKVTVYTGYGVDLADYTINFIGVIKLTRGISYNITEVTLQLEDLRGNEVSTIPPNKFWESNYPGLESRFSGLPIPIIYGDFSDMEVPVACIDASTSPKTFKIADHPILSIIQVYKNGVEVGHQNEDLTEATFTLAAYVPLEDLVTAKVQGIHSGGVLITHPMDILQHLQVNYVGVDVLDIDVASYTALKADWNPTVKVRQCIITAQSSDIVVPRLAFEMGFDLIILENKYMAQSRMPNTVVDYSFDETTIEEDSLKVEFDPDNLYSNRLKNHYCLNPVTGLYTKDYIINSLSEQAKALHIISKTTNYHWLYQVTDLETLAERQFLTYSTPIKVITFRGYCDAILVTLAKRVGITIANFVNRPLMVRNIERNFTNRKTTIIGFDIISFLKPGFWMVDTAPTYLASTIGQRATSGYWTNNDGEADPGDADSIISNWW